PIEAIRALAEASLSHHALGGPQVEPVGGDRAIQRLAPDRAGPDRRIGDDRLARVGCVAYRLFVDGIGDGLANPWVEHGARTGKLRPELEPEVAPTARLIEH